MKWPDTKLALAAGVVEPAREAISRNLRTQQTLISASAMAGGAIIGFGFRSQVVNWLELLLLHANLSVQGVPDSDIAIQATVFALAVTAMPVFAWNIVTRRRGRYNAALLIGASCLLTVALGLLAYFVVLPLALGFLANLDIAGLHALISANSYRGFITTYILLFIAAFHFPALIVYLNFLSPIDLDQVTKWRPVVYIVAAVATLFYPLAPDPISKLMLFVVVILGYEAGRFALSAVRSLMANASHEAALARLKPGPQRLPMAIAVGNSTAGDRRVTDPLRAPRQRTVKTQVDPKQIDDARKRLVR